MEENEVKTHFNVSNSFINYTEQLLIACRHAMINYVNTTLPALNLSVECLLNFGGGES